MRVVNRSKYVVQAPKFKPYTSEPRVSKREVRVLIITLSLMMAVEIILAFTLGGTP